jgi:hypothetical protein
VAAIRLAARLMPAPFIVGAIAVMSACPLAEEQFRGKVAERRADRRVQEGR